MEALIADVLLNQVALGLVVIRSVSLMLSRVFLTKKKKNLEKTAKDHRVFVTCK